MKAVEFFFKVRYFGLLSQNIIFNAILLNEGNIIEFAENYNIVKAFLYLKYCE